MNLNETLSKMGIADLPTNEMKSTVVARDEESLLASYGMANDSFHFAILDIVPPKNTVPVKNIDSPEDKKDRKSKKYLNYERERQLAQDPGPRRVVVQTIGVDNSDVMDSDRSRWFV